MDDTLSLHLDPEYQREQGWPATARQQASNGNVRALLYLAAVALASGNGSEALKLFRKAARDHNNLEGTTGVIKIYEHGAMGVDADLVKACQWMKKILITIESTPDQWKHPHIQQHVIVSYGYYMLGERTPGKYGRPKIRLPENKCNATDGLKWLGRVADMGDVEVARDLASIYISGRHPKIPLNYEKAMEFLPIAAEAGSAVAAYALATEYYAGWVPVDEDKYRFWLKKAAELGHAEAIQEMSMPIGQFGIQRKEASRQIKKLQREEDIEELLETDESTKCFNPACNARETAETGRFSTCVVCRHVKYCSKVCQKIHWKSGHKQDCPKLKEKKDSDKKIHLGLVQNMIVDN